MLSKEYGITILISSHILAEIEQIADTIGVINQGRLIKEVSMDEIQENNTAYIELVVKDTKKAAFILSDKLKVNNIRVLDNYNIRIYDEISQSELTKALVINDVAIEAIHKKSSSLEDYFLSLLHGGDISA
ncbi:hypothetical protein D3C78_1531430 [compost metagenome]